jgi:uncharacterized protein
MNNGTLAGYRFAESGRKITVSGEGSISATPDKATATLGIRTESQNLQEAQAANAQMANEMLSSLLSLGISRDDIKTADFRIDPIYTYEDGKQIFQGYRVTHLFTVTIRDVDKTGLIIDTAVKNGANEVMNIQFSVAEPQVYYNQALSLAVMDSFKKARTIAKTLGTSNLPYPISIKEETQKTAPGPYLVASFEKVGSSGTPIEPGTLEIKASVTATYISS